MKTDIIVKNLKKSFNNTEIFCDFNASIESGKITVIFGPNGSGKSTLLNILSGIIKEDGGNIQGRGLNPFEFSYIFQNYRESLLPWRTNFENLALPLEIQRKDKQTIKQRIDELQELFNLEINWLSYPYELSSGQQQILAFMRAFITKPKILFIDEPFSALDYENNLYLREHLQKYYLSYKPTILLITHNIEEAVHLGEKIIVFSQKPTRVLKIIDNPLPYPRTIQSLKSKEFNQVEDVVLSIFQKATKL